jgi:oligopeptide transport system ATP-binding protein
MASSDRIENARGESPLLRVDDLRVQFSTTDGTVNAVNGVSFDVASGECVGVVGESGSGKSQVMFAAMRLLAENGKASGEVLFDGQKLFTASSKAMRSLRGNRIGIIFQDPMTALTPHLRIGDQLAEVLVQHRNVSRAEALAASQEALRKVGISAPDRRMRQYPHELSGGMRQRVLVVMAMLCKPSLLIADEPTTALDVTVQGEILEQIRVLKDESDTAVILVSHDIGVVASLCDRVLVMYAGSIVEQGATAELLANPRHPYTIGLLKAIPRLAAGQPGPLHTIPGAPPQLRDLGRGCPFAPRCDHRIEQCDSEAPTLRKATAGRSVACHVDTRGLSG